MAWLFTCSKTKLERHGYQYVQQQKNDTGRLMIFQNSKVQQVIDSMFDKYILLKELVNSMSNEARLAELDSKIVSQTQS